jgi:hypothetical protein
VLQEKLEKYNDKTHFRTTAKDIILEQINPFIQPQSFIILGFISTIFSGALLPLVGFFVPRVLFALAEF